MKIIIQNKLKLTSLSAAGVIRHSLNGGDGLNSTTICRNSDCSFGYNGFIYLKSEVNIFRLD